MADQVVVELYVIAAAVASSTSQQANGELWYYSITCDAVSSGTRSNSWSQSGQRMMGWQARALSKRKMFDRSTHQIAASNWVWASSKRGETRG